MKFSAKYQDQARDKQKIVVLKNNSLIEIKDQLQPQMFKNNSGA